MAGNVREISDSEFEAEVLNSDTPVLVDFWAPWCGPCMQITPFVEEVADDFVGRVKVVKVNVDENRENATQFNIQALPSFVLFKDGEVAQRKAGVGASPKKELVSLVESVLV